MVGNLCARDITYDKVNIRSIQKNFVQALA